MKQAVDEVQVARPARRQLAGNVLLGPRRERRRLLMPRPHPADLAQPGQAVAEAIETVARPPDTLGPGLANKADNVIGNEVGDE